jgi:uncharacterized Zn finger protein
MTYDLIKCDDCGCQTFDTVYYLMKISRLVAGTVDDVIKPMPAFACSKCGHINEIFLPPAEEEEPPMIIS